MKNEGNGKSRWRNIFIWVTVICVGIFLLSGAGCCGKKRDKTENVRLVVMVVIDQLRADMVSKMEHRFGKGGFKYLMDRGVWYKNARYRYVTTITSVGHATLFTGADPANHGIVGNAWYDRKSGKRVRSTEIPDPNDSTRMLTGPYQLTSTTIGDELALAFNRQSRVFSVSLKDRGAILPAGYLGKAFWYDLDTGGFRTGDYYYKNPPQWLSKWNNLKYADRYGDKSWERSQDRSTYIYGKRDDRLEDNLLQANPELPRRSMFPHKLADCKGKELYEKLTVTPFADELTVDFAAHVLKEEKLGQGAYTDMLTVSLSVTDIVGHTYGPDSLEYEDNLLRVDKALEKLFTSIDKTVGLNRASIVLAGDHGCDLIPEFRTLLNMPGGRIDPEAFKREINAALQKKFGVKDTENFVIGFWNPSIYLDLDLAQKLKLNIEEVEQAAAEGLMKVKGIAVAVTRSDLLKGNVQDTPLMKKLKVAFHPGRSGNILIIQEPFWYLYPDIGDAAMHGSPYAYDSHVPIFFAGPGIKKKSVYRLVCPEDIAVTVALKLGIEAPPAASGDTLIEVFD
jgi:predicted AlkP superfamily pyrophosphatase or phosphodiesterase